MTASINDPTQLLVTGDARLVLADIDVSPTLPTSATDTVVESDPWFEVGYITTDGIAYTENRATEAIRALQAPAPVRTVTTTRDPQLTFALMQTLNAENLILAFAGGSVDTDGAFVGPLASDGTPERAASLDIIDGDTTLRLVWPRVGISEGSSWNLSRSTSVNLSITLTPLDPGEGLSMVYAYTDPTSALEALGS